jgi:hypothetical protein
MKPVLFFYPHCFSKATDGTHARFIAFLRYLQCRNITTDVVCLRSGDEVGFEFLKSLGLVRSLFAHKASEVAVGEVQSLPSRIARKFTRIQKSSKVPRFSLTQIADLSTPELNSVVCELVKQNDYGAVVIAYAYYAAIAESLNKCGYEGQLIVDTHDFLSLQQYYLSDGRMSPADIGRAIGDEIERLSQFHDIIHISSDEMSFFSSFLPSSAHHFVPHFCEGRSASLVSEKEIDVLFVGSNNRYNKEALSWFFNFVLPLLSTTVKIAIAGQVCGLLESPSPNVQFLGYVDDLASVFAKAKLSVCPIRRGTGLKIKVIESLGCGVPVVTTRKGLDGFESKSSQPGVFVVNDAHEMAIEIQRIVDLGASDLAQLSCQASDLHHRNFSFDVNCKRLDRVFFKS